MIDFHLQKDLCISCGLCARDCVSGIIHMHEDFPIVEDEIKCLRCGHCLAVCPQGAISVLGRHPSGSASLSGNLPSPLALETRIKGRRSVRNFKERDVDPSLIKELLDISSHAPTGTNSQMLELTLINKREVMNAFRADVYQRLANMTAQATMPDTRMGHFLSIAARLWREEGRDLVFRNAPHCLLVSNHSDASCVPEDPVIFLSYFELMAQAKGVGTCWCGFLYSLFTEILPDLAQKVGIPDSHAFGYAMLFGYPAFNYARTVERATAPINVLETYG